MRSSPRTTDGSFADKVNAAKTKMSLPAPPVRESLPDPLDYYADIQDLSPQEQRMVMCDNLKDLLEGRW